MKRTMTFLRDKKKDKRRILLLKKPRIVKRPVSMAPQDRAVLRGLDK